MKYKKSILLVLILAFAFALIACEGKKPNVPVTNPPTSAPSETPAAKPTDEPTTAPTTVPTNEPVLEPTKVPDAEPTEAPTVTPANEPATPTSEPVAPTSVPTTAPTGAPTSVPTTAPTGIPTTEPTGTPSAKPTCLPTQAVTQKVVNPPIALTALMPTPVLDIARTDIYENGTKTEKSYDSKDRLVIETSFWQNGDVHQRNYYIYDAQGNGYVRRGYIYSDNGCLFSDYEERIENNNTVHEIKYGYDYYGVLYDYVERNRVSAKKCEEITYSSPERAVRKTVTTYVSASDNYIAQIDEYVNNAINTVEKYRYDQYGSKVWLYTEHYKKGVILESFEEDHTAGCYLREKKVYYKNGKADYAEETFYRGRNDVQTLIRYYGNGSVEYRLEYAHDTETSAYSITKYSGDNKLIERENNNNGKRVTEYFDNGTLRDRIEIEFHPDRRDAKTKETKYKADDSIEYTIEWVYNSKIYPISETKYNGDGKLEYRIENTYCNQLYLEYLKTGETLYSADNKQVYRMVWDYSYYNSSKPIYEAKYDENNKLVYAHEWVDDKKVDQIWYDKNNMAVEKISHAAPQGKTSLKADKTSKGTEFNFVPATAKPTDISKFNTKYFKSVLDEAVGEFEKKGRPSEGMTGYLDILVKNFDEFVYFDYMIIPSKANGKTVIRKFGVGTVCIGGEIKRYYVGDWDSRKAHPNDDSATNESWFGVNECAFDWDNGHGTFEYSHFNIDGRNVYKVVFSSMCLPDEYVPATVYTICIFDDSGIQYIIDYQEKVYRDPMEPKVTSYTNYNLRVIDKNGKAYTCNEADNHLKSVKSKDGKYTFNLWKARENASRGETEAFEIISGGYSLFFGRTFTGDLNTQMVLFD